MHTYFLSQLMIKRVILFSLAILVINMLTFRYLVNADIESVDLTVLNGHTIIIDPGHGGIDSGARYNNLLEKDINLAFSKKLGQCLSAYGATVLYTREDDSDYYIKGKGGKRSDLLKRVELIDQSNAEVFVSIHCNAVRESQWYGSQVFYNPKNQANKFIAEIMQDLLKKFPPNNKRQAKQDLQILLLNSPEKPGVLVETGYLSNKNEARLLSDSEYQERMAMQISKGLAYYFKDIKS
ncbi:MAG: cwlD 1 [Massilibacillus sp.]|nr:cwlD 1 [Massilibacillus sp.]